MARQQRDRDQVPYSKMQVEGLVEGQFRVWDGPRHQDKDTSRSWYVMRSWVEETGRIDPGWDAPDRDTFLEVIDLERALTALNAKGENDRSEAWRMEAAMVLILLMQGFSFREIASVMPGRNVFTLAKRAEKWIVRYLNGGTG